MKKALLLFCLCVSAYHLSAQKINIDSLIRVAITQAKNSPVAQKQNRDSLFILFTKAKQAHLRIALIYQIINNGQGLSKDGLSYHYKILRWAKKNNDLVCEAVITAELGFQTGLNGDVAQGIKMSLNALQSAQKTNNNEAIAIAYDCLGVCYSFDADGGNTASFGAIIKCAKQGLTYAKLAHNDLFITYQYGGLGSAFNSMHQTDSAIFYTLKSFEYSVRKNITVQIAQSLLDLGDEQKDDNLKLKYYKAGADIAANGTVVYAQSSAYVDLGHFYKAHRELDSSMLYARKAYALVAREAIGQKIQPSLLLSQLYSARNADSALKYTNIYHAAKDSMFSIGKAVRAQSITYADQQRVQEIEAQKIAYAATSRVYLLGIVILFLVLIAIVFWHNNNRIKRDKAQLQHTLDQLKATQTQLIQSEKMASLGELTAGIAHEIQNPLNFVNNFSEVSMEMIDEMELELKKGDTNEAVAIAADIKQNLEKIHHHGKRADGIVKGMLQHSRASTGEKEPTNINTLADEFLKLSYHGLRAKDKTFNAELVTNFDEALPKINIVQQDIGRVLLNLFNNAFYAVNEKQKSGAPDYKPTVTVSTCVANAFVLITVRDNGAGIPQKIVDKIYQPFFTTKPTGQGTGLGLSLSYDIVKANGGDINVETQENIFTQFNVQLPLL